MILKSTGHAVLDGRRATACCRLAALAVSGALFLPAGFSAAQAARGGRQPAPPAVLSATGAEIRKLAHRPGAGATLVSLWATWCDPCRKEFPGLQRVIRERAGSGVRLLLVSADFPDQLPGVRKFLAGHGVRDTTYIKTGDDMTFINSLDSSWSGALPATFIFDQRGRLASHWEGEADADSFARALDRVLAGAHSQEDSRK